MSREQLSSATKVSLRHIAALESGRYEQLPAGVFSKGFVRVIALHLGLDAERSVTAFRHVHAGWEAECARRQQQATTSTAGLRLSQPRRSVSSSTTLRGIAIALALAAVTGAAAFMRSRGTDHRGPEASTAPVPRVETGPASLALPPAVAAATVALPAGAALPVAASSAASRGRTLTLSFRDECWAEVFVDGRLVVRGLFPKGSRREFANGGTFTLTLGNAGAVDVIVDGRPLGTLGGEHETV
ncbi:MAG TPA: helix-turn-helix domain-containing protein, partial [Thermoanaerobaculia bacterium]|nr:helix-turn-helix domain-containing protein [Thermoanaerobaculia bacterium]